MKTNLVLEAIKSSLLQRGIENFQKDEAVGSRHQYFSGQIDRLADGQMPVFLNCRRRRLFYRKERFNTGETVFIARTVER